METEGKVIIDEPSRSAMEMAESTCNDTSAKKARLAASQREEEVQVIPQNSMPIVYSGLMCTVFLTSLDNTIVATALPTIIEQLGGGNSYSWVGSAYTLSAGASGPLFGKLSDMFGRKPLLYSSIFIFLFGSAMCGAAQSMTWLIACRSIQGLGCGGILQLVVIIMSDIVPLRDRGRYSGYIGAMYGIASVAGPVVGGALAEHASWRWCFFINLPIGGVAAAILFIFLNLNPHQKGPILDQVSDFDFMGLFFFVTGTVCVLIGFDFSQSSWSGAMTIAPLAVGFVLLISGGVNEVSTKRSALLPPRLFKTRTTVIILITAFFYAFIMAAASYYLPLFYQVLGASATVSGVKMITFSLGISLASLIPGFVMVKTGRYRPIICVAYVVLTLGMGLMTMLNYVSTRVEQTVFPLVAAVGIGSLFQAPITALQAAMPIKDMATASSGFMFTRNVGTAVGIAIGEAIITSILSERLESIPSFNTLGLGTTAAEFINSVGKVHLISDVTLRNAVLHAWSEAISGLWILLACMSGVSFILSLFLREYSLQRKVMRACGDPERAGDPGEDPARPLNSEASPEASQGL